MSSVLIEIQESSLALMTKINSPLHLKPVLE